MADANRRPTLSAAQSVALPPELTVAMTAAMLLPPAVVAVLAWRDRSRLTGELREARARSACLEPLFDAWLWHTDALHRSNDHLDREPGPAARMKNLIDALLALSRLSSHPLARRPVNLSLLATYVIDDLRRQSPDRAVRVEFDSDIHTHGDPSLLCVMLISQFGNAWKYTGKAEDARIAFRRHAVDHHTFTVEDNGAGFDMRFADRLFGVFQRLHSTSDFPGTGIGLASVRRIVCRNGGEIWVEAEVDKGARLHFSLPQGGSR